MAEFTHFNESGRARMVDVSAKGSTERAATAQATVFLQPETLEKIQRGKIAKGDPVEWILAVGADFDVDLIVMTTEGHTGLFDLLRGSTTERVVRGARCPLLAIPA